MTPKMVLFDFGGTLWGENFNALAGIAAILPCLGETARTMQPLALALHEQALIHAMHAKTELEKPLVQIMRLFLATEGIPLPPGTDLEDLIYRFWLASEPTILKEGVVELLQELHRRNIRAGVISNTGISGQVMRRRLDASLPGHHFELVITSCDYLYCKPDAMLFRVAEKLAGLSPDELVYCGNSFQADVRGAAGAGWSTVWYNEEGEAPPEDAEAYPHKEIRHWRELFDVLA
ncbi:MAG: HAD family hydrolase [Oscillospiraceae bacterium]|jgi:FMN phosphatase YigB (HAD superfamily)|nr:HAD family hydrolase [Oscillospiraceae bacterium]